MRVVGEPALEARDLGQWVDEDTTALATVHARAAQTHACDNTNTLDKLPLVEDRGQSALPRPQALNSAAGLGRATHHTSSR